MKLINVVREKNNGITQPSGAATPRNSDAHERVAVPQALCALREHTRPRPKSGKAVLTPGHAWFLNRAKRSDGSDTTPARNAPVSPCEPLCARLGAGMAVRPTRGDSARTGRILGRHKNGEYATVTRGRPAFQQHEAHAEGSDTTPMQERQKSTVCRREQRVRRRRAPTLRKPFFLLK